MAKRKSGRQRPFRPSALDRYVQSDLRPRMDPGEHGWRYTVVVPVVQLLPERRAKATPDDLIALEDMLLGQFGGLSRLPRISGYGLRNPRGRLRQPELNEHVPLAVYTAPLPEADDYFRDLQRELQEALNEGVILVERQDVILL
jgi:hypothetical protein